MMVLLVPAIPASLDARTIFCDTNTTNFQNIGCIFATTLKPSFTMNPMTCIVDFQMSFSFFDFPLIPFKFSAAPRT